MNKQRWYFDQIVSDAELLLFQADVEAYIERLCIPRTGHGNGILIPAEVDMENAGPSLNFTFGGFVVIDPAGKAIALPTTIQNTNVGISLSAAHAQLTSGKARWVSVCVREHDLESQTVTDGRGNSFSYRVVEDMEFTLAAGTITDVEEGVALTVDPGPGVVPFPTIPGGYVELFSLYLAHQYTSTPFSLAMNSGLQEAARFIRIQKPHADQLTRNAIDNHDAPHGIRQGSGNLFDADTVDDKEAMEIVNAYLAVSGGITKALNQNTGVVTIGFSTSTHVNQAGELQWSAVNGQVTDNVRFVPAYWTIGGARKYGLELFLDNTYAGISFRAGPEDPNGYFQGKAKLAAGVAGNVSWTAADQTAMSKDVTMSPVHWGDGNWGWGFYTAGNWAAGIKNDGTYTGKAESADHLSGNAAFDNGTAHAVTFEPAHWGNTNYGWGFFGPGGWISGFKDDGSFTGKAATAEKVEWSAHETTGDAYHAYKIHMTNWGEQPGWGFWRDDTCVAGIKRGPLPGDSDWWLFDGAADSIAMSRAVPVTGLSRLKCAGFLWSEGDNQNVTIDSSWSGTSWMGAIAYWGNVPPLGDGGGSGIAVGGGHIRTDINASSSVWIAMFFAE